MFFSSRSASCQFFKKRMFVFIHLGVETIEMIFVHTVAGRYFAKSWHDNTLYVWSICAFTRWAHEWLFFNNTAMINTRPDGGDVRLLLLNMKHWYVKFWELHQYTLLLIFVKMSIGLPHVMHAAWKLFCLFYVIWGYCEKFLIHCVCMYKYVRCTR